MDDKPLEVCDMPVIGLEVIRSEMFANGTRFGDVGAYRRIEGIARYAVDPEHAANAGITDLELAERTADGRVLFDGDISMLVPADLANASGALMVEVPNRGNRIAPRSFNQAPFDLTPTDEINMGDGFLMHQGWCIAWVGWQWDMPACIERLGLRAPQVPPGQRGTATHMHLRIQPDQLTDSYTLTDHHVGAIGNHAPIPPMDADDPQAQLLVREHLRDEGNRIDRDRWRFATDDNGNIERVALDGGFEPGRIYDLLYTPRDCPVAGVGLLAVRDFASFARHDATSPIAGAVTHTFGQGISQCGRFLRTLMFLGLNVDEGGRQVFDGILAHIAGGRRGEFNQRYGQPSVQPTPSFGHLFPFADEPQTNPQTGEQAGLLDKLRERGVMPRVMYTDTSSEYWRGDAGLTHTTLADNSDADLPGDVRRYLFASTQHGPGLLPYADRSIFGSHGSNFFNAVDYRPLFRAALENLRRWVMDDIPPPDSVFPRRDDGTGMTLLDVIREDLKLTGTKKGCNNGDCGACTVLLNGKPINACLVLAVQADGQDVASIEGVALDDELHPIQEAFLEHGCCSVRILYARYDNERQGVDGGDAATDQRRNKEGDLRNFMSLYRIRSRKNIDGHQLHHHGTNVSIALYWLVLYIKQSPWLVCPTGRLKVHFCTMQ